MGRPIRSKADVVFHGTNGPYNPLPAVNVKCYNGLESIKLQELDGARPDFTQEWIERHLSDEQVSDYFYSAREHQWECLQDFADEIFPGKVKVYSEGRSGGWAVVEGLRDFERWDAIDLARWRKFASMAESLAADVPYQAADLICINAFATWHERRVARFVAETEANTWSTGKGATV